MHRTDAEQIAHAERELKACVPWLDWQGSEYSVLDINRAEPAAGGGQRPDEAYAVNYNNIIQCFPTKLTLAPDLGDKVLDIIDVPNQTIANLPMPVSDHPKAVVGVPAWQHGLN